ncbi:WAT1-related protein At1g21890-like isoform X5 [Cryptomeria japonica]|uniref:WAT1-related protein At1g21890-like isoform X5 n=1 Tax=Cryptomeria japonica TaxID=3369 RepID=UPI0025AB8039|nr:WAT1-related protein At1g21890-like isoform X5 [Cryptomeria japonica]
MMVEYKLYVGQILVQAGLTGMYIIVRIAFDNGMNRFVYVAYRQAVATLVMAPIAYFLERNDRPPMTCTIFWQIFLIALSGISVSQNLFFIGLAYTSATFTAAIINVLPIVTSVMAIAFRQYEFGLYILCANLHHQRKRTHLSITLQSIICNYSCSLGADDLSCKPSCGKRGRRSSNNCRTLHCSVGKSKR